MLAVCFFFFYLAKLKGEFFWENPNRDFRIQRGFCLFLSKSKNVSRILEIHTMGGFLGSNPNPHFWDSSIELLSWERIWKQYFWPAVFRTKTGYWQQVQYMYDIKTEPMLVTPFFIRTYHFREEHKGVTLSWQWSFFRIFHFFGSKESIGSEITNLFLNSSKNRTPQNIRNAGSF